MAKRPGLGRREFIKQAAVVLGAAAQPAAAVAHTAHAGDTHAVTKGTQSRIEYPRIYRGPALKMVAFPLGGVAAGSIALGGRGQLRDWEIFNRPNKGYRPGYSFPSIWARIGNDEPVARVLEARIEPPYEGQDGLGSANVPGLTRLDSAIFTGEYPLAHIDFSDNSLPVQVKLDAFSPFIPHEPDDSGLPVTILRYSVKNPNRRSASVSIAFSLENPIKTDADKQCVNAFYSAQEVDALLMSNPTLPNDNPMKGTIALAAVPGANGKVTSWAGWPAGRWWDSPLLFWDQFSHDGSLGKQPTPHNTVGAVCLQMQIAPGATEDFLFLLGWHFPNRLPEWMGWDSPPDLGKTNVGNFYATRFENALEVVQYTVAHLDSLESRTRAFAAALRDSTLPSAVKDAASANLSTLVTTTCFRTADGEFHGFEGSDDTHGCCFGNCAHVWNYETTTPFLFPSFARSLRRTSFGYSMDDEGGIHFRQMLPDGHKRWGYAAADGQMGQIVHAWLDWKLSGDTAWVHENWPRIKKAIEFAWIPGGWDANKDGVLEGVQHNTYDVEFYGPNPMCSIYYLAALRACVDMAHATGDTSSASEYQKLFESGRSWIDSNLFNGEFYIQQIRGFRKDQIAPSLIGGMGATDTEHPEYQVGAGCFVDQLIGQYLADVGGLDSLVSPANIRSALESIFRYNYKPDFSHHDNVARTYVLNHEAGVVVCDYAHAKRPRIPFPYFAESWTGIEYPVATLMMCRGMVAEGMRIVESSRSRFDGEKRNPWDEAECGHHYARAMSAWSMLVAMSGFRYNGIESSIEAFPKLPHHDFSSIWATGTGWGTFRLRNRPGATQFEVHVQEGSLRMRSCAFTASGVHSFAISNGNPIAHQMTVTGKQTSITLKREINLLRDQQFSVEVRS
ncbi:MAG: hypothetical protein KGN79_12655 [Acidobacteriota bacterium]|nr:hypothetical protein [Acidobacteriota bacterium]